MDGLRLQSFKSSHRSAQLTQLNAGDYVGRHNHVPFQAQYLYRAPHHDRQDLDRRSVDEKTYRYHRRQRRRRELHDSAQWRRLRLKRSCCSEVLLQVPVRVRAQYGYTPGGFLYPVLVVEPNGCEAADWNPIPTHQRHHV